MKNTMDKYSIIKLKLEGRSNRSVAKTLNINRKTVSKYWDEYEQYQKMLEDSNIDFPEVQEKMLMNFLIKF